MELFWKSELAGGDESSIFASEILRMYTYLAQRLNFQLKIISTSPNPEGGYKEVIAEIYGSEVYSWFKYEGGVHRVQRVPVTEKQGRIHTSTISVAILPLSIKITILSWIQKISKLLFPQVKEPVAKA